MTTLYLSPTSSLRRSRISTALALMLPLASMLLLGCSSEAANSGLPPPPAVSVMTVSSQPVTRWDVYSGRMEAVETVQLRPRVAGYIDRVNFAEGQEVKRGDVLFEIDPRSYRAALHAAEAQLAQAASAVKLAASEAQRARQLVEVHALSAEELDQREATLAQAKAQQMAAQAAVDRARLDLEFTEVRAPISGRAGRALVTAGNLVSPDAGTVLTTLVSQERMYVYFDGDERSFLRYRELARSGERASELTGELPAEIGLVSDDGFPHRGSVDFVDNQVDPATGTIRGRAVLDNRERLFTPGLYARVRLPGSGEYSALLIDEHAIRADQDRSFVWVVADDGTAQRRDVSLGDRINGLRVVTQGLNGGERVVVHGGQRIFAPGMPVQASPLPAPDTAAGSSADHG